MENKKSIPGIRTKSIRRVRETNNGLYIWQLPEGKPLMDDEGNFLCIPSQRGDLRKMAELSAEARSLGYEGTPVFQEGAVRLNEEEWAEQVDQFLGEEY